jgi:2-polyprenyl-3-methyl-5-hydroxy-6-metoxy-1,4-benzoquinol methylase
MNSKSWDERYAGEDLVWSAEPNRFLVEQVAGLAPGRALDVACGEGRNAIWLAEQGFQVTGVDFSAVGLDKARRLAAARGVEVDFVEADVLSWRPPEASFDLVVLMYLQLGRDEMAQVLGHLKGGLAPGGVLLVVGHDTTNLTEGAGGPQNPAVLYSPDDLVAELGGLEVEQAERVRRPIGDGERVAIDALVRARQPAAPPV